MICTNLGSKPELARNDSHTERTKGRVREFIMYEEDCEEVCEGGER